MRVALLWKQSISIKWLSYLNLWPWRLFILTSQYSRIHYAVIYIVARAQHISLAYIAEIHKSTQSNIIGTPPQEIVIHIIVHFENIIVGLGRVWNFGTKHSFLWPKHHSIYRLIKLLLLHIFLLNWFLWLLIGLPLFSWRLFFISINIIGLRQFKDLIDQLIVVWPHFPLWQHPIIEWFVYLQQNLILQLAVRPPSSIGFGELGDERSDFWVKFRGAILVEVCFDIVSI